MLVRNILVVMDAVLSDWYLVGLPSFLLIIIYSKIEAYGVGAQRGRNGRLACSSQFMIISLLEWLLQSFVFLFYLATRPPKTEKRRKL